MLKCDLSADKPDLILKLLSEWRVGVERKELNRM